MQILAPSPVPDPGSCRSPGESERLYRMPRWARRCQLPAVLFSVVLAGGCSLAQPSRTALLAIVNVTVIDVVAGQQVAGQTVLVRGSRIERVGPAARVGVPAGATVVDGAGRYLLPGLADMHVHLYTEGDLLTYVANGITTVRNMAGDGTHLAFRRRIGAGEIVGPRIVTAGPVIEAELSHPDNVLIADPADVRGEVLRQRALGYDFVKVYNRLAPAVYDSLLSVAWETGFPLAGHVPIEIGLERALEGHRSIEHLRGYLHALATTPLPESSSFRDWSVAWNQVDETRMDELAARTASAGVWNCPTFTFTVHELSPTAEHERLLARPELRYLSLSGLPDRSTASYLREFSDDDYAATQSGLRRQFELVRALDRAGAGLLVGTDSWLSGLALADEAALLVEAGLTPARVLRMATSDAAEFLGRADDQGSVEAGRVADLVLLDADPIVDIANLRTVRSVILNGRLLDRGSLDDLLNRAAADAAARK